MNVRMFQMYGCLVGQLTVIQQMRLYYGLKLLLVAYVLSQLAVAS